MIMMVMVILTFKYHHSLIYIYISIGMVVQELVDKRAIFEHFKLFGMQYHGYND